MLITILAMIIINIFNLMVFIIKKVLFLIIILFIFFIIINFNKVEFFLIIWVHA